MLGTIMHGEWEYGVYQHHMMLCDVWYVMHFCRNLMYGQKLTILGVAEKSVQLY